MFHDHATPLVIAYLIALGGWLLANRVFPGIWQSKSDEVIAKPRVEFGYALLGVIGILVMGMLWTKGIRIPESGMFASISGALNQILIFMPIILVMVIRRQSWDTAWIPKDRIWIRILVGLILASLAVTTYSILRVGADSPWTIIVRIWRYEHLDKIVQVFLEDLTIAILFIRLAKIIGHAWATVVVACLFAAGHIPVMVSQGTTWLELYGLLRDAGLGVAVILILQKSRDFIWFWFIHFCMDMTQFNGISGVG
ncbi:MAG: hypothetical protein APR63_11125 [Desulfuromonas sp. SDB]|nr:MAG: hypothetical protein APR63_11125 [Desulfuromonas sp. SDB]